MESYSGVSKLADLLKNVNFPAPKSKILEYVIQSEGFSEKGRIVDALTKLEDRSYNGVSESHYFSRISSPLAKKNNFYQIVEYTCIYLFSCLNSYNRIAINRSASHLVRPVKDNLITLTTIFACLALFHSVNRLILFYNHLWQSVSSKGNFIEIGSLQESY